MTEVSHGFKFYIVFEGSNSHRLLNTLISLSFTALD